MALDFNTDAHEYQRNGAAHLYNSTATGGVAVLWLDPGYGKTMIVLHTFKALYDAGIVKNMMIVAPLRVAQTVWGQEIDEWASLNGLVACRLHGTKKEKQLTRRDVNIWIVNYEGIPWAIKMAKQGKMQACDVVVYDEIRRMKNAQGKRFKAARPLTALAKFKWGLTGTPASNGLLDLFGQFLILDDGASLGKYITKYRAAYFEQGYDGFSWLPRPGAQQMIEDRIKPYIYRADGYLDLPEFVDDIRKIVLPPAVMKKYREMKQNLIADMDNTEVTAANAAVLVGKLKQMANGRVYDENRKIITLHAEKKEALIDLIDELGDEQLLIAYEFNHDLTQLREVLGDDLPYLGAGINEKTAMDNVDKWNSGEIRVMAAHPASAGHGLNLQKGSAHHILWWGPTIDLDHYIQFNRRLLRQGNKSSHVVVHTFVAEGTVDETVIVARTEKDGIQSGLLSALTAEFGDVMITPEETKPKEDIEMSELTFKSDANQQPQQQAASTNPFAQGQAGGQAPAPSANPFAQTQQAPAPQEQQAPAANPFAQGQAPSPQEQQAPAPNPFAQGGQQQAPAPSQNPFGQGGGQQQQQIEQAVAAAPIPQPDPSTAPANPFAQTQAPAPVQQQAPAPQEQQAPAPVIEEAQVVEQQAPVIDAKAQDTGWTEGHPTPPTPAAPTEVYVPFSTMIPADKMDKVLAAIGRALK